MCVGNWMHATLTTAVHSVSVGNWASIDPACPCVDRIHIKKLLPETGCVQSVSNSVKYHNSIKTQLCVTKVAMNPECANID